MRKLEEGRMDLKGRMVPEEERIWNRVRTYAPSNYAPSNSPDADYPSRHPI